MNENALPVVILLLLLVVAMISPEMQINNFTPVLEKGIIPILKGIYLTSVFFAETIVMVMIIPFLNRPQVAKGTIIRGVVFNGLFQLIAMVAITSVLGARTARIQFPFLILARQISIAELIERVEPFIMLIVVVGE